MKKLCCVLWVGLALIGSTSRGFGELPPSLTQSTKPPSVGATTPAMKPALFAGAARVAQTAAVALPPMEGRKLDYGRLERDLAGQFPQSKVYLIPMHSKVIVRGQCPTEDEATKVLWAVNHAVVRINGPYWKPGELSAFEQDLRFDLTPEIRAAGRIINELQAGPTARAVPVIPGFEITSPPHGWRQLPLMQSNSLDGRYSLPETCFRSPPIPVASTPVSPQIAQLLSAQPTALKPDSQAASTDNGDQFQSHLRASEASLRQAGLTEAAKQLQSLHGNFEAQHTEALFTARKEAQLKSLQAEIALLRQSADSSATQVSLRIRLVEVMNDAKAMESIHVLLGNSSRAASTAGHPAVIGTTGGVFESAEFQSLLDHLCKTGDAKVVSEPQMTLLNGQQGKFLSGGEFAVPSVVGVGGPHEVSYRPFGTSVEVCPLVTEDRVRLTVVAEYTRQEDVVQQASNQAASTRRVTTTVEMRPGQTLVLKGLKAPQSRAARASQTVGKVTEVGSLVDDLAKSTSDDAELLIVITPEIVTPMEPSDVPPVPGFEVFQPTQLPPAPVPSRE